MNTSLRHLSAARRRQIELAKKIIVQAVQPEMIILFGVYSDPDTAALFDEKLPPALGAFDLLVITRDGDRRSDYELQDVIENRCRGHAPVTVLVHDLAYINRKLAEGQYFFSTVTRDATLLYDTGKKVLIKATPSDLLQVRLAAERDYERWGRQAKAFFRSALFNQEQKEWRLAAFLLHQAVEHIYQAILLVFTGYKPTTHNLDKLRRYTNRFSVELALLFSREKKEEEHLFQLLLSGYVDARYKEDYSIRLEEVGLLISRVEQLLDIADRVCRNRLLSLGKKAAGV